MWGRDEQTVAAQAPRPRIVQHDRRRYSIRLENAFWKVLEQLARRHGLRLGRYIAGLAAAYSGNNLSSYLRVVCMLESERTLAEARLRPSRNSLLDLVGGCPSPGLVVSRARTIVAYNRAFAGWLGPGPQLLAGADLTEAIQVRTARSFNEIWAEMVDGRQGTIKAHVLHVRPGKVRAAQATLVPLRAEAEDSFHVVVWLEVKRARGALAAAPARAAAP